jgi:mono/diheme cytochrome c family protein
MRVGALLLVVLAAAAPARGETPHVNYMLQCQGCHLADGGGKPGAVPPLAGFVGRFLTVPGGREFLVRVPGSAQSPLSDAELAALLNWMVSRFGPAVVAADFTPFTAREVARVRRPPLTDVGSVRRELVGKMEGAGPP